MLASCNKGNLHNPIIFAAVNDLTFNLKKIKQWEC